MTIRIISSCIWNATSIKRTYDVAKLLQSPDDRHSKLILNSVSCELITHTDNQDHEARNSTKNNMSSREIT